MDPSTLERTTPEIDLDAWLERVVAAAAQRTDAFEIRAELSESIGCSWEDGSWLGYTESRLAGACVRVWVDGAEGFASCHDPGEAATQEMVDDAIGIAQANARKEAPSFPYAPQGAGSARYEPEIEADPFERDPSEIASLLERVEEGILDVDDGAYARPQFASSSRRIRFADAEGRRISTRFLLSTLQGGALNREGDRPGEGITSSAGERGLTDFEDEGGPEALGRRAAEQAKEAARAKAVPPGRQPVLCDPKLSGLLAHESFGHLAEYDLVSSGWSRLAGRLGQRFSDTPISVVDAPTSPTGPKDGIRVPYDAEGTQGHPVRVLDDGVLSNWMHKRGSAGRSDQAPTGNARALNVRYHPLVRMRNTYIEPGGYSREELLEELGDGVYLMSARGGAPASDGSFVFTADRGYLVEEGEIQHPLRPTTISGNILDFLQGLEALGDDLQMHTSNMGGCGKWGQSGLPVGTGGPHVLVSEALVGGRS